MCNEKKAVREGAVEKFAQRIEKRTPLTAGGFMMIRRFSILAAILFVGTSQLGFAQTASRVIVAQSHAPAATFSARPASGNQFHTLGENEDLYAGDLLVSLPGGALTSKNGAVTLKALSDFDGNSPLPILETAISLNDPKEHDLDFLLDRGRVDLTNTKSAGSASVRLHFWDQTWTIVLDDPETRVAVELCGRWPSGSRFKLSEAVSEPATPAKPVASLVLLVLKGSAAVNIGTFTLALQAPPGPAEIRWNSITGTRAQPLKLQRLPNWANAEVESTERGKRAAATVEKFRQARAVDPAKAIDDFLTSSNPAEQRVALITLGALDELPKMGKALSEAKNAEEWDFGITVLRHWLGRSPGQEQKLYSTLINLRGYTPSQAKCIIQMLFGFSEDDLKQPETYEVLIEYLVHEKAGIRNLAAWHLIRLVPEGKAILFKPNGTAQENAKTYEEWQKIIPKGKLPPSRDKTSQNP
jgi:hypothetical protein